MKGIVCAEADRLEWVDHLPEPVLAPGHAIVTIKRVGICGTDLHAYKGNQPFFSYPRILGHELAGVIEAVNENEAGFEAGDQVSIIPYMHCGACIACRGGKTNCCTDMRVLGVHIDGGMRERITVPVERLIGTKGLTLDQTAVLEPLAIGAHAVRRSGLAAGETALVIGGGPIGLGVMAIAKHAGAKVIAMDVNEERLAFCGQWAKADAVVHALQEPLDAILAANGGELPAIVFDATGNAKSMNGAFQYASHGGRLVFVGLVKADITFHDPEFHKRELTLMASRNATREDFDTVMTALAAGAADVSRYITHRVPFAGMIGQFESYLKPETKVIKAMIEL
ncbi:zinc-binding alcohol dehydrogenase family protein [Paenibacillus sacheonensis]|uniref:Alcohol dehydrogenase catalytic domain-containing protein n=1 Tax=Paenibacillus sacheonensis TaxID=742054 RepID=A0A7X4YJN9_9BACL|nr:zinc-binding alcohol dehydrogenase family protein [Paenibacillus sacheonensis]MBM7564004.1 2-desacetyl-2-hydroxyethyl bacteriochlorophyllide A dehydrogenase [Paenibacillus sacheonensis]NBC67658.1 alcohol dehydrogenase catalytic domain-containing protein [Paenibacillus sacheonensis]